MMESKCPECEATIKVQDDVMQGEIVSCPDCGLDFEVAEVKPDGVTLKEAEAVGEDWGE